MKASHRKGRRLHTLGQVPQRPSGGTEGLRPARWGAAPHVSCGQRTLYPEPARFARPTCLVERCGYIYLDGGALVITGTVCKAVVRINGPYGVQIRNVFHARIKTAFEVEDVEEALADWEDYLVDFYTPLLGRLGAGTTVVDAVLYQCGECTQGEFEPDIELGIVPIDIESEDTGEVFPMQVAVVLTATTARLKSRGRKFLGPIPEALAAGGYLIGSFLIEMADVLAVYIGDFGVEALNWEPGIWSYATTRGQPSPECPTFRPFVGGFVRNLCGTWRRRKPGVGA